MMTIPKVRQELAELASKTTDVSTAIGIRRLIRQLHRRPPASRAAPSCQPITPELAKRVREYALKHPNDSQLMVANVFGINPGRVSEILRGKRG